MEIQTNYLFYFEITLPNGAVAQILDVMDYVSNNVLMPIVSIATCILIGWIVKPDFTIKEFEKNGYVMGRKKLFTVMICYITPVLLFLLLLKAIGVLNILIQNTTSSFQKTSQKHFTHGFSVIE